MDNVEFKGKYLTRAGIDLESFPVPDETKLWFVWGTSTNTFLVQPLDQNATPTGEFFPLDEKLLDALLLPIPQKKEALKSNARDLLNIWYKQVCEKENIAISTAQITSGFTFTDFVLKKSVFSEGEDSSGLTPSSPAKGEELQKGDESQKSESLEMLSLLREGKELLPEGSENNWHLPATFTEMGLVLRRKKSYDLALLCHNYALTLAPDDERILFNIARTEFEMGHHEESKKKLQKILSINPHFTLAKDFLAFLEGSTSTVK